MINKLCELNKNLISARALFGFSKAIPPKSKMASVAHLDGVAQLQVAKAAATAKIEEARISRLCFFIFFRTNKQDEAS